MSRNYYKESDVFLNMENRGQVALFVLVGIAIIAVFIWLVVYPKVNFISGGEVNPSQYMKDCLEPELKKTLPLLTEQGGYAVPTLFTTYESKRVQYLCYISENYLPCVVQQPLLVSHIEKELNDALGPKARECLKTLQTDYESKGYNVNVKPGALNATIVPGSIRIGFDAPLTVTKDNTQTFRGFAVSTPSELYLLLSTATNIVQFESTLGDSETLLYLQYYPDLKIEKLKKEADTIYTLTNVVTKERFRFATRSLVWPSGYGVIQK